jgi:hypothetical protein
MFNKVRRGNLAIMIGISIIVAYYFITLNYINKSYSEAPNQAFSEALEQEQWLIDYYTEYKSYPGHKAFAVAIQSNTIISAGFAYDNITMDLAEYEALYMCQYYSEGLGTCVIVDKDSKQGWHGLSQKQIDAAPEELISHGSIKEYYSYKDAKAPKAFVIAADSGQAFWFAKQETLTQTEDAAMEACENNRHPSDPHCLLLESE